MATKENTKSETKQTKERNELKNMNNWEDEAIKHLLKAGYVIVKCQQRKNSEHTIDFNPVFRATD